MNTSKKFFFVSWENASHAIFIYEKSLTIDFSRNFFVVDASHAIFNCMTSIFPYINFFVSWENASHAIFIYEKALTIDFSSNFFVVDASHAIFNCMTSIFPYINRDINKKFDKNVATITNNGSL